MIRNMKLLLSSLLIICFTHTALAQSSTTDDTVTTDDTSPLTTSVISDCREFLNTLATQNLGSLSPKKQRKALSDAASNPSSLLICYQNNACQRLTDPSQQSTDTTQQPPLSANPNCSQYLSLWYLSSTAPKPS